MSRVLVVTLPERGHYHPLLGPAEALLARGHEVSFACVHDIRAPLHEAGVREVHVPPGAPPPSDALRGAELAKILVDPPRLAGWIRTLLVEAPRAGIAPLRAIIRDVRPDVVAIDTMAYDGAIAAELEGVPWVGWATSLNPVVSLETTSELIRTLQALDGERHRLFEDHGVSARFRVSDVLSPRGTAVFADASLVAPGGVLPVRDPTVHLVGPSLGGSRGGERADTSFAAGRPILYVSFGSQAWHQPARFARLFEATAKTDWAVIAATGQLDRATLDAPDLRAPSSLRSAALTNALRANGALRTSDRSTSARGSRAPAHVRCVSGLVDQLEVLRHARAMVTHGGANSLMEACALGVALLVAPICNDQPHGAAFVARAGNGLALDLERCSDDALEAALHTLAHDAQLHAHVARVREGYAARSGSIGAAELVERACR